MQVEKLSKASRQLFYKSPGAQIPRKFGTVGNSGNPVLRRNETITLDDIPKSPGTDDPKRIIGDYFHPDCIEIDGVKKAIDSTARVVDPLHNSRGAGTIVKRNGEQYFVTAYHNVEAPLISRAHDPVVFFHSSGTDDYLEDNALLRIVPQLGGDCVIYSYDKDVESVGIASDFKFEKIFPACLIGFPVSFDPQVPSVSFGFVSYEKPSQVRLVFSPPEKFNSVTYYGCQSIGLFLGETEMGFSGAGVFNLRGEILGVHRGFDSLSYKKQPETCGITRISHSIYTLFEGL